jgi:hypothetical protein
MECFWMTLPSVNLNMLIHRFIIKKFFSLSLPDAKHNFDGLWWLIIWFFLCLPTYLNTICFPSQGPLYCPQVVNFSRSFEKCWCHFCQGFCKLAQCSSCLTFFFALESNITFQRSCLFKSNCWNEIREMSILKSIFEIQASLVKGPTHAIQ